MNTPDRSHIGSSERAEQVRQVVLNVLQRRASGDKVSDEEIISQHSDLMPELGEALVKLRVVTSAAAEYDEEQWLQAIQRMNADRTVCHAGVEIGSDSGDESRGADQSPDLQAPLQQIDAIGKYRVIELLDMGGQAVVYRAVHPTLPGKELAIKLSRWPITDEKGVSDRLEREGKLLARLDHPALVRVYDLGLHENHVFVAVDLIRGRTLDQHVEAQPLSSRDAAMLVAKVARGAAHAHELGIVHQDIKPRNIVVDDKGEPHLIDFGLALLRYSSDGTPPPPGEISGTAPYMAPEQACGKADQRSDVFALGAVLYALLVGSPPFDAPTPGQSLERARRCDFDRQALRRPGVSRSLARICLKAMEADPVKRYSTAAQLADDLLRFVNRTITRKWGAVLGLLLLALVGIGSWIWSSASRDNRNQQAGPATVGQSALSGNIIVFVWNPQDKARRGIPLSSFRGLPLKAGDQVRLDVQLNRPAYLYIVWIDTEGSVYPVYPWRNGHWLDRPPEELPRQRLGLPEAVDVGWPIAGPAGTETVMLLARETPLSKDSDLSLLLAGLPRQGMVPTQAMVSFDRGAIDVDALAHDRRPQFSKPQPLHDSVLETQRLVAEKLSPHFSLIRSVSFPNQGE